MTTETIDGAVAVAPALPAVRDRSFFGEPKALGYLAFTEAWERFSFYGMIGILALYLGEALLLPGRAEHVVGLGALRAGLESLFGPLSTVAFASQIYGLYTGFVYFTPVFGGLIADRWLGRRRAVIAGALLMSAGHVAMAFDASFLAALALLVTGCGLLKGNISAQVGGLYPEEDGEGRTRAFAIFSVGINVGAVAGPLGVGLAAQLWGWHAGFGLAGLLMLLGLATYLAGYRHLPEAARVRRTTAKTAPPLRAHEWRVIAGLVGVMATTTFQSIIYYQNGNIGLVWIDRSVDLTLLGFRIPVAWFNSIDPFASIAGVPLLFAFWRWQTARGREPREMGKIATGAWLAAGANLLLAVACLAGGRVPAVFPIAYDLLLGIAFLYYWPTLLALVSGAAPAQVKATLMGAAFLSIFVGNLIVGWIGGFYETLGPAAFWGLQAAIGAVGGLLAMALAKPLERLLAAR